jgi:arginine/lysine/ornithine decarboxylase
MGFVSTSVSNPILASLELGIRQLVQEGDTLWNETIECAELFRQEVRKIPGISCFGREQSGRRGFRSYDPTRVTLDVSGTGLTGIQFSERLVAERIYPELATLRHLLFLFTPGTNESDSRRLLQRVRAIARTGEKKSPLDRPETPPPCVNIAVSPRKAKFAPKETISICDAVGRIAGETIATYPPGVPIIVAGEIVSLEAVEYLLHMREMGAVLKGATDPFFQTLRVLLD